MCVCAQIATQPGEQMAMLLAVVHYGNVAHTLKLMTMISGYCYSILQSEQSAVTLGIYSNLAKSPSKAKDSSKKSSTSISLFQFSCISLS